MGMKFVTYFQRTMKRNRKWAMLSVHFGYQMASIMMLRCYRKEVSEGFHFFSNGNIFIKYLYKHLVVMELLKYVTFVSLCV